MSPWESKLRAEGLAPLDYEIDDATILVSHRGSGHDIRDREGGVDAATQLARRDETEAVIDQRRDILRSHRFPAARDRRIWAMHADGIGTREIAEQLHHDRRTVRASIAATNAATKRRATRNVDPIREIRKEVASTAILAALCRAFAFG
jgi:DNA-binding NarL/FixJ family response regulator